MDAYEGRMDSRTPVTRGAIPGGPMESPSYGFRTSATEDRTLTGTRARGSAAQISHSVSVSALEVPQITNWDVESLRLWKREWSAYVAKVEAQSAMG